MAGGLAGAQPALAATYGSPSALSLTWAGSPPPASFAHVDGMAVSSSGTAYVLEGGTPSSRVHVISGSTVTAVLTLTGVVEAQGIAVDSAGGQLYVADTENHRVVKVGLPTTTGAVTPTVVVGNAAAAGAPLEGPAASSPLRAPRGVAWDAASSALYIADTGNNQVEKVVGGALAIVAGTGLPGNTPASTARSTLLNAPEDVAVSPSGDLFIADTGNNAVLKVTGGLPSGAASAVAAVTGVDAVTTAGTDVIAAGTTTATAITSGGTTPLGGAFTDVEGLGASSAGVVWVADDASTPTISTVTPSTPASAAVRITSAAPTSAVKGAALSRTFTATGSPTPTWSFVGGAPACLTGAAIGAATGVLTGTPGTAGTCSFTVRADNTTTHDEQVVSLTVGSVPPAITAKPVAVAAQGSATLTWTAPTASTATGEAVTGYVVTPSTGGTAGTPRTLAPGVLSATMTGLTSGASYTFTVAATNAFGTAVASPASVAVTPYGGVVQPPAGTTRVQGGNRITTAVSTSQQLFPGAGSARAVVLASSTSFADSLAGARLASAVGAPLLLTDPLALNSEVAAEIARVLSVPPTTTTTASTTSAGTTSAGPALAAADAVGAPKPTAVGTVYLLGGTTAVSGDVETAVKAVNAKYAVTRISGADRYETATKIAAQVSLDDPVAGAPVYLASGRDYPDGLAVAALAARTGGVVLLTDGASMAAPTATYLQKFDPNSELVVAVGGPAARAAGAAGADRALVGSDRYDTARRVAERSTALPGSARVAVVGLATGDNWPDALAGAAAMGNLRGPLLLTPSTSLSPAVAPAFAAASRSGRPTSGMVFGGPAVVSPSTASAFGALVSG